MWRYLKHSGDPDDVELEDGLSSDDDEEVPKTKSSGKAPQEVAGTHQNAPQSELPGLSKGGQGVGGGIGSQMPMHCTQQDQIVDDYVIGKSGVNGYCLGQAGYQSMQIENQIDSSNQIMTFQAVLSKNGDVAIEGAQQNEKKEKQLAQFGNMDANLQKMSLDGNPEQIQTMAMQHHESAHKIFYGHYWVNQDKGDLFADIKSRCNALITLHDQLKFGYSSLVLKAKAERMNWKQ